MVISAVAGADKEVHAVALPKQFIPHGSQDQLRSIYGLDVSGIVAQVKDYSLDRRIFSEGRSRHYSQPRQKLRRGSSQAS